MFQFVIFLMVGVTDKINIPRLWCDSHIKSPSLHFTKYSGFLSGAIIKH